MKDNESSNGRKAVAGATVAFVVVVIAIAIAVATIYKALF